MRWQSLLACGLLLAGAEWALHRDRTEKQHLPALAGLKRSIAVPQPSEPDVQAKPEGPRPVVATARAQPSVPVAPSPPEGNPVETARLPPPSTEDIRDYIKLEFEQERVDPSWAREAKPELAHLLSTYEGQGSRVADVACKARLCRVELEHDDEASYQAFLARALAPGQFNWGSQLMVARDPSTRNPWHMLLFLARSGAELPRLD